MPEVTHSGGAGLASSAPPELLDVVIVGAGFGGMYAVYRLRELGFSVRAFEAGDDVGGTWYWNTYPGARCDIESLEYSYSFSEELQQEWEWSQRYPVQPEMYAYARHVADRFDLRPHITFDTRVTSAAFDESTNRWEVLTDGGHHVSARFCVLATGCLSAARIPEFPGRERFAGESFHTGRWPRGGVDFTGKRVAVIGTGASGVQSIPLIAEQAARLTVFQRTPSYSVAGANAPLDPDEVKEHKANYAAYRDRARRSYGGVLLRQNRKQAVAVSAEERNAEFETRWGQGGFSYLAAFDDLVTNPESNELAAEFVRDKIRQIVKDPAVADLLSPKDYPIGAKRICMDTGYYDTYNKETVSLVDVRATPIEEITERGIRTSEREYAFDAIVYATGFDAMTGSITRINLRGRDGLTIQEKWAAGPKTYLGLSSVGFPNLFIIAGPGSPSVISNVFLSIEQHVDWIGRCLTDLRDRGVATIEPEQAAEDAWVEHVNEVAAPTLYMKANSWYLGANVPGKARVFMPYVGGVSKYHRRCAAVADNGYEGFVLTA